MSADPTSELLDRLRRSEARFHALVATQTDAALVIDHDGLIRFANPCAAELFEETTDALVGQEFGAPILSGRNESTVELRSRSGATITAAMRAAAIEWDGGPAWIVSLRDIRRELLLEREVQLAQRLESLGRLTGGVAHDFNNLLSVILNACEGVRTHLDVDGIELTDMIEAAARRGADLTRSLLAFARRQPLAPEELDVGRLLTQLTPMLQRTLGDSIDVVVEVPHAPHLLAHLDRAGFESAILNLCVNARDAMESGGRLRLVADTYTHSRRTADDRGGQLVELRAGDYVLIQVADEGTGIAPEHMPHLFEPFFTTKAPEVGTGLGLPMVYGFALQSAGLATVDSKLGVGTTVSLYLPRAPAERTPVVRAAEPDHSVRSRAAGVRILLVEDGDLLRELVTRQLEHLGHDVTPVATAHEALAALATGHHDLMLSDIRLGGSIDGHDLVAAAQGQDGDVAVLLMSGLPPADRSAADHGAEILHKPFGQHELAAAVERAIRSRFGDDPPG